MPVGANALECEEWLNHPTKGTICIKWKDPIVIPPAGATFVSTHVPDFAGEVKYKNGNTNLSPFGTKLTIKSDTYNVYVTEKPGYEIRVASKHNVSRTSGGYDVDMPINSSTLGDLPWGFYYHSSESLSPSRAMLEMEWHRVGEADWYGRALGFLFLETSQKERDLIEVYSEDNKRILTPAISGVPPTTKPKPGAIFSGENLVVEGMILEVRPKAGVDLKSVSISGTVPLGGNRFRVSKHAGRKPLIITVKGSKKPVVKTYKLWINGVQVTDKNKDNLASIDGVSGKMTYNPSNKQLDLHNVTISGHGDKEGIRSEIDGLRIQIKGHENRIEKIGSDEAIRLDNGGLIAGSTASFDIITLQIYGSRGDTPSAITIGNGTGNGKLELLACTLVANGAGSGIYGGSELSLVSAKVVASGASYGSIRSIGSLKLGRGIAIVEPVDAREAGGDVVYPNGNIVKEKVVIDEARIVTFKLNGGELNGNSNDFDRAVEYNKPIADPGTPTKASHSFEGWYKGSTKWSFSDRVQRNMTLEAKWEFKAPIMHTVTFDLDGGKLGTTTGKFTRKVQHDEKVDYPGTPTKAGHTFKGWYEGSDEYKFAAKVTGDLNLKAKWEAVGGSGGIAPDTKHRVTFILNGGELNGKKVAFTERVKHNEAVAKPSSDPTKAGHTFKGWFKDGAAYVFTDKVTEDIFIEAQWEATGGGSGGGITPGTKHPVTFVLNGGELNSKTDYLEVEVKHNEAVTDPGKPVKVGYDFEGWFIGAKKYVFTDKVTKPLVIVAKWKPTSGSGGGGGITPGTEHRVIFVLNDGELKGKTDFLEVKVKHGEAVTDPGEPTRTGYDFEGWFIGATKYVFADKVTKPLIITAKWKPTGGSGGGGGITPGTKHTVTFILNGGELNGKKVAFTERVKHDEAVDKPSSDPTKSGHTFKGWFKDGAPYVFTDKVTEDIYIEAQWESTSGGSGGGGTAPGTEHTVTFALNGGELSGKPAVFNVKVKHNDPVANPGDPTKAGYDFEGWFRDGAAYVFSAPVTEDMTIYAKWRRQPGTSVPTEHTVTFVLAGGELNGKTDFFTEKVQHDKAVAKPSSDPSKTGYDFKGWFKDGAEYAFTEKVTEDITITAKWKAKSGSGGGSTAPGTKHTVTFELAGGELNGKTGSFTEQVEHDKPVADPGTPTKDGHTFKGWFKGADAYIFTASVTEDITLTAQWEATNGSGDPKPKIEGELVGSPVESASLAKLTVFPNPAAELIVLEGLTERALVRIYNLKGQLVHASMLAPAARLDVRDLQPGSYLLQVNDQVLPFVKK